MSIVWNRKDKVGGDGILRGVCLSTDTKPTDVPALAELTDENGDKYQYSNTQWVRIATGGAASTLEQGIIGGEKNTDSESNNYDDVRRGSTMSIISKQTAVTIGGGIAGDTRLHGLNIHTALTGTCVVTGFPDTDDAATSYTIPAGSVGKIDFYDSINTAGPLTITCSNVADNDLVAVFWSAV